MTGVAIVGLGCRLPGADTPARFWQNLCAGVDSISFLSDDALRAAGVPPALFTDPGYVKAAAMVEHADRFDAGFFGFSPREAALLDPQQRILLEVAWETFEDAGYHPESYDGVAGVFAGGGGIVTSYLLAHAAHPAFRTATASVAHLGNDKDFLATRVSYKLNLTGPSITVQTACSTSLVAVHLACQSLRSGECDMALAAATTVRIPQVAGYLAEKGGVYSLDGRCRAFDAAGQGTIFGSGVAAVLLKTVDAALADGDRIYAVVAGSAVNNDGGRKVSYPSPSVTGQARAMVEAFTLAECSPDTVGYVECHATGTVVGDPPEILALTRAFRQWTQRSGFCAVGSVKTNIGHPEQTAGLAGLIKTALALSAGAIPPSLHFRTPNPKIDFASSPFFVNTALRPWPDGPRPRRAAVNSLGIGGTNAFVVLEEAPAAAPADRERPGPHVVTLSAKTEAALGACVARLADLAESVDAPPLADLAYTSNVSRSQLPWRVAVTADAIGELGTRLRACASGTVPLGAADSRGADVRIAMLFSGQGSQYAGMAMALYRHQPAFRDALDRAAEILRRELDVPLLDLLEGGGARLDETGYTQPAIVAVELALAEMWQAWGVRPAAVLGHSVGEISAACVAGVFGAEAALRLVAERARLMQSLPAGGEMVSALGPEAAVRAALAQLGGPVGIAAVNGPAATVISGERRAVRAAAERLAALGVPCRPLRVSRAFHSALMDPILGPLERAASGVPAAAPAIPLVSNVTGALLDGAPDGAYWRAHARECVRFAEGLRTAHALGIRVFLEVGPGAALTALGRSAAEGASATWLPTLPGAEAEVAATADALARLYAAGVDVDWRAVHQGMGRRRVSMPTYPFERRRHWLEPAPVSPAAVDDSTAPAAHPLLGELSRDGAAFRFETAWGVARMPYLSDHRIGGAIVLPTALAVEAALAAARVCFGEPAGAIEDLVYHEVLRFDEAGERRVRIALMPAGPDRANVSLATLAGDGAWRTHVTAVVTRDAGAEPPADTPRVSRCRTAVAPDRFYADLRGLGIDYGPAFRGIAELRRGRGTAVARVRLPAHLTPDGHGAQAAFLDACLHVFPALLGAPPEKDGSVYLPVSAERVRVDRPGAVEATVTAVLRTRAERGDRPVVDVCARDDQSRPVLRIEGLALRPRALAEVAGDGAPTAPPSMYEIRWTPKPRPASAAPGSTGAWLLLAEEDGLSSALAAELERRGQRCHRVLAGRAWSRRGSTWRIDPRRAEHFRRLLRDATGPGEPPLRGAVVLRTAGAPDGPTTAAALAREQARGAGAALLLSQALLEARAARPDVGRLWLVTRNVQRAIAEDAPAATASAMLWGFGRTVALEAPAIWGGLIDLPRQGNPEAEASSLAGELLQADGETQIALRDGVRHVARLTRMDDGAPGAAGAAIRADATYLITGGLGMLGLETARYLVDERGARSIALVGRRRPGPAAARAIAALRARGARVCAIAADVGCEADVARMLRALRGLPPVRGVFHGAGLLDDALLADLTPAALSRVAAAKVTGSWLLHRHTRALPLDLFVLHSSLLSLTGSPGQANYTAANAFMDALVDHRRALGLPATALNWGPWAEGGMARSTGARGEAMWRARGVGYLAPRAAVRALDAALRRGLAHAAVADVDWPRFLAQAPVAAPFFDRVSAPDRTAAPAGDLAARLRGAAGEERRALLRDAVRDQVMRSLGFTEPIDTRQPLSELGLDSLMSVNVANRLEIALGVPVPVAALIRGPSVDQLADALANLGETAHPPSPPWGRGQGEGVVPTPMTVPAAARNGDHHPAEDPWLIRVTQRPAAAVRLVCFPFAGAGAAPFRPWAEALHPSIELIAVEPPGRASRIHEAPEADLERFLTRLADAISPVLDRPAAFFGHCLGGLIGWEVARRLRDRGRLDLRAFFVAGVRPPHRIAREGPFELGLLERLLKHESFDPLRPVHEQPDEVFAEVTRHFEIPATDSFLREPELRTLLLPTVRADFALTAAYRHTAEPPWDVPITCFAGLDDPYVSREDAAAWSDCTRRSFRLLWRPGAHFLVMDDRDFIVSMINQELAG